MPRTLLLVLALGCECACAPSDPGPEGPHLLYSADPLSLDNPVPDQRLVTGGAASLRPKWYQPLVAPAALTPRVRRFFDASTKTLPAEVAGFGNFGQTLLRASEPVDAASLAGRFARLRKVGGGYEVLEPAVPVEHVRDWVRAHGAEPAADQPDFFLVRPTVPLREGDEGVLVALAGITTAEGAALRRGRDFDGDAKAIAAALGVAEADVLLSVRQVGVPVTAPMKALAAWADANPPAVTIPAHGVVSGRLVGRWAPADADWGQMKTFLEWHSWERPASAVGQVVVGELGARDLRGGGPAFNPEWLADPSRAPVVPLAFVLTLPQGPKPAGGWPVVIGAHGAGGRNTPVTGGDTGYCLDWAQALAARGLGCIGIDAVSHGSRGVVTQFFAVTDLPALRDRFREMTFDLLQLERAVSTIDVDGDGAPDLAPQVRYFGNSLGGIMGAGFLPYANRVTSAVLNVPGAGLSNILVSQNIGDLIGLLLVAETDLPFESPEYYAAFPLFRTVGQAYFEPADPVNAAYVMPAARAVLVQLGKNDKVVPNQTTEDLARALGAEPLIGERTGSSPLRLLQRVDPAWFLPASEAATYDGHGVLYSFEPVRRQALRFLESDGTEASAASP